MRLVASAVLVLLVAAPTHAPPGRVNYSATWDELFEASGSSAQTHWLLPTSHSPVKTLSSGLPEYYGATVHSVIPTDGDVTPVTLVLRASVALRDNVAAVFGYFLYLPDNDLSEELHSALRLLHDLVRLRRVRLAELVPAVPEMAGVSPCQQFLALFRRMAGAVPRFARGAVDVWKEALEADQVDVDNVMRPNGGPLVVDFLAGFDHTAVQRLSSLHVEYNASEDGEISIQGDKFMDRVFYALRARNLPFSQRLFGLFLSYRSRNAILPDKEESERYLVAALLHSKLDGWERMTWSFKDEHLEDLHDFIRFVLSSLLQSGYLKLEMRGILREVLEYVETPKPTFSLLHFDHLANTLTEPSLDVIKLLENVVTGEYPNEIIYLRRRLESYIRNGFLNVELALRGFNRFDYATPNDILIAFLTRLQRQFRMLPHDILSTISHLKEHINFKNSRHKLHPILNSNIINMLQVFESYYVADEVVVASLKLKAQLQLENYDFSDIIQKISADECGQPRSCIHIILREVHKSNVLLGKKSKESVKDFLDLLNENGEPIYFLRVDQEFQNTKKHLNIRTQSHTFHNGKSGIYRIGNNYFSVVQRRSSFRKNYVRKRRNKFDHNSFKNISTSPDSSSINKTEHTMRRRIQRREQKTGQKRLTLKITQNRQKENVTTVTATDSNLSSIEPSLTTSNPVTPREYNTSDVITSTSTPTQSSSKMKTIVKSTSSPVTRMPANRSRPRRRRKPAPGTSFAPIPYSTPNVTPQHVYTPAISIKTRRKRNAERKERQAITERAMEDTRSLSNKYNKITTKNTGQSVSNTLITTSNPVKTTSTSVSRFFTPVIAKLSSSASNNYTEILQNNSYGVRRKTFNSVGELHRKVTKDLNGKGRRNHFKNRERPIIYLPAERTDPGHSHVADPDSQEDYHSIEVRRASRKRYRSPKRKRTHRHRKGHSSLTTSTEYNTKRSKMKDHKHSLADEDSAEVGYPLYYIEEDDSHDREKSCEDDDGNCDNASNSRGDKSDENKSERDEALPNSGGESQDEGSKDAVDTNRDIGVKYSTNTTPHPVVYHSTTKPQGNFKIITREWRKKSRKRRKHHKHGIRPVGYVSLEKESHRSDHPSRESPFGSIEIPLLHGRKPIRYRIVMVKRSKKRRSKRVRRRRKKIPKGNFQYRHSKHNDESDREFIYKRNATRRLFSSVGSSEEQNYEDSHDLSEGDDVEYEICDESDEDYPKCADEKNYSEDDSHLHYDDDDVVIVKPIIARGFQESREDSGEEYDDDDNLQNSSYEDSDEFLVEYDDDSDLHGSHSKEFPDIEFTRRSIDGYLEALYDWKRRLVRGWEPPKFTLNCQNRQKHVAVCQDTSPSSPVIYTGISELHWKGKWTYFRDPLQVTLLSSQPPTSKLLSAARKLELHVTKHQNTSRTWLTLDEAVLTELIFEALALQYDRSSTETPTPEQTTSASAAVPRRPAVVGLPAPSRLATLDGASVRRALAGAADAELPAPDEAAELEPANVRRLDALLPFTAPGSLADVKLRPLRMFLALPRARELLGEESESEPFVVARGARKGPLLREVLGRVLKSAWVAKDPLLTRAAKDLLDTWNTHRRGRPGAKVEVSSLADALPPPGAEAEGAARAVEAARALLTRSEWRDAAEAALAAAEAAAGVEAESGVTKGQLLGRMLRRASEQNHSLADALAQAARWVSLDGLGAQAPSRTLPAAGLNGSGSTVSVDLRALLRDNLDARRVLGDARAAAGLRALLRACSARGFDPRGAFRGFDAARAGRTRAQLLREALRHLADASGDRVLPLRARAAARALLPFVEEEKKNLPAPVPGAEGKPGNRFPLTAPTRGTLSVASPGRRVADEQRITTSSPLTTVN